MKISIIIICGLLVGTILPGCSGSSGGGGGGGGGGGDSTAAFGNPPSHYYFSDDGTRLLRGKERRNGLYDINTVEKLELRFMQADGMTYNDDWFSDVEAASDTNRIAATLIYQDIEILDDVGVQFKSLTNGIMVGNRQSFDIKLDDVVGGQDLDGYDLLNLHNTYDDASYMREIFYLYQSRGHTVSADGNFINLYINEEFWGLYPNVQQMDRQFLDEWYLNDNGTNWRAAGSGLNHDEGVNDGTTALNYLGDDYTVYIDHYELKSTSYKYDSESYRDLANAISALENVTADTLADFSSTINVDEALWFLAYEILFGDDNGYISKGTLDYMVYFDNVTKRVAPHQYDGKTVMKDQNAYDIFYQSDDADFPLAYKLFGIPELRQRYLAHVRTVLLEKFDPDDTDEILTFFETLIDPGVQDDPYPHDGITYAGFPAAVDELRDFIADRYALLNNHPDVSLVGPVISDVSYSAADVAMTPPDSNQPVVINTTVSHGSGVLKVTAYYATGYMGPFDRLEMFDDGLNSDQAANDGIYGVELPPQAEGVWVRYYVEAIANDGADGFGSISYSPAGAEHDVYIYRVNLDVIDDAPLRINEFMASNTAFMEDGFDDGLLEFEDWVELYNTTDQELLLDGYYLTDNAGNLDKWAIPAGTTIPAFGFITFWLDSDQEQGEDHASFRLDADGEELLITQADADGGMVIVDFISFGPQQPDISYGRFPDGTGAFEFMSVPTYGTNNIPD